MYSEVVACDFLIAAAESLLNNLLQLPKRFQTPWYLNLFCGIGEVKSWCSGLRDFREFAKEDE